MPASSGKACGYPGFSRYSVFPAPAILYSARRRPGLHRVDWKHGMLIGGIPYSFLDAQRNPPPCTRPELTNSKHGAASAMDQTSSRRTERSTPLYGVTIGKGGATHEVRIHS
jgi:hypothetical protein